MKTICEFDTVTGFVTSLKSQEPIVRCHGAKSLGRMGDEAEFVIPRLKALLEDRSPEVRVEAVRALGRIGPAAIEVLNEAFSTGDRYVRREIVWALGKMGKVAKESIPVLRIALRDSDLKVRLGAVRALGMIGPDAETAITDLIASLRDTQLIFCRMAANSLSQIGRSAVLPLMEALRGTDRFIRQEAAWALGSIGSEAREAVPLLIRILVGLKDAPFIEEPIPAHDPFERAMQSTVTMINETLKDDPAIRPFCAQALGRIAPDDPAVVTALSDAIHDPDSAVARAASQALRTVPSKGSPTLISFPQPF